MNIMSIEDNYRINKKVVSLEKSFVLESNKNKKKAYGFFDVYNLINEEEIYLEIRLNKVIIENSYGSEIKGEYLNLENSLNKTSTKDCMSFLYIKEKNVIHLGPKDSLTLNTREYGFGTFMFSYLLDFFKNKNLNDVRINFERLFLKPSDIEQNNKIKKFYSQFGLVIKDNYFESKKISELSVINKDYIAVLSEKDFFNKIFKEKSDLSKLIENKDNIIKLKDKQIAELKNESFFQSYIRRIFP
jgi:hypothetical protein